MKRLSLFSSFFFLLFLAFSACNSDQSVRDQATESAKAASPTPPPAAPVAPAAAANPGNSNLPHYYCSNNCAGSGGDAAGSCPVCGTAYVHNQAFHNTPSTPPTTVPGASTTITPPAAPKTPEPAQNAAGVWHYTCSAGCAGGAGAQGSCSKCGGALAHNQAYHQ